jgi:tRNA A37 methylthiotransferase MiaB
MSKININSEKRTAFVVSNGCPENRLDVARAEKYLLENGWTIEKEWQNANLILFNACGRSSKTETHSLNIIKEIERQKKESQQLIVWGCLPKIDKVTLTKEYHGPISPGSELTELKEMFVSKPDINQIYANTLGPVWALSKKNAPEYLRFEGSLLSRAIKKPALRWDEYIDSRFNLVRSKDPSIFYIKISTGCRSNCTYCAIRKSRGLTKSKPIENVLSEFREGLQKGFSNFSLMGTDLGSYGVDLNHNLVELLETLTTQLGEFRISLRNIHPHHLKGYIEEFLAVLKTKRIPYIEMAAESGSNHVLQLMNRTYSIEEYKELVQAIREAYPPIIIRTQLIAGFPGETQEDFKESMQLIDDIVFDYVEVYEFSERPGTAAASIEPKVPDALKRERFLQLYRKAVLNRTRRKIKNIILNKM